MSKPTDFRQLLAQPNRSLASIYQQIDQQKKLLSLIKSALPDHLKERAAHCVIDRSKLIVYADSANWASQLRFYRAAILGAIDKSPYRPVDILQFRITEPLQPESAEPVRPAKLPGKSSIANIRRNAELREDDPLAGALLRLSETLERLSKPNSNDWIS